MKKIFLLALAFIFSAGFARAQSQEILSLFHFDDATNEQLSGNEGTLSGIGFEEGKVKQGILIEGKDYLYYPAKGAIDYRQGTVEFWYKPLNSWSSTQDAQVTLFLYDVNDVKRGWWEEWIAIYGGGAPGNKTQLVAEIGGEGTTKDQIIDESSREWKAGEWHHIAVVWSKDYFWLFSDGTLRAEKANPFQLTGPRDIVFVGNDMQFENWSADGTMDELIIWDYPKNPWEIEEAAKNPGNPSASVFGKNLSQSYEPSPQEEPSEEESPPPPRKAQFQFPLPALGLVLGGVAVLGIYAILKVLRKEGRGQKTEGGN